MKTGIKVALLILFGTTILPFGIGFIVAFVCVNIGLDDQILLLSYISAVTANLVLAVFICKIVYKEFKQYSHNPLRDTFWVGLGMSLMIVQLSGFIFWFLIACLLPIGIYDSIEMKLTGKTKKSRLDRKAEKIQKQIEDTKMKIRRMES